MTNCDFPLYFAYWLALATIQAGQSETPYKLLVSMRRVNLRMKGTDEVKNFSGYDEVVETVHDLLDRCIPIPPMDI